MTVLRVAAAQVSTGPDPVANLATATAAVRQAASGGAELVVLPEATLACFGIDLSSVAEPLDGPFATGLRKVATDLDVVVAAGLFEPSSDGRVHNTVLVTGPGVEASYRKIHLYDAFGSRESDIVAPGKELVTFRWRDVTIGLATCYDLRFAERPGLRSADRHRSLGHRAQQPHHSLGQTHTRLGALADILHATVDTSGVETVRARVPIL